MKKLILFALSAMTTASVAIGASTAAAAPVIDRELMSFARGVSQESVRVIALLQPERLANAPQRFNHRDVVTFLQARSRRSFDLVRQHARGAQSPRDLVIVDWLWINTSVVADVTPQGLRVLAQIPGVERIYMNRVPNFDRPVLRRPVSLPEFARLSGGQWPYDLLDIGMDKLAEAYPEVRGTGVLLGSVDTGVDARHPLLANKVVAFFDAGRNRRGEPFDSDSHGTHTIGTMVGGDLRDSKIGIAVGAKMVATAALSGYDAMLRGMQYMIDPDGNPATADYPRAINNSWNCEGAPDLELFYRAIAAWEAAGILPVFSAGNAGPRPQTITKPHEYPGVIAVAATGLGGKVTSYSSRGPAVFRGQRVEKPDVSAPGDNIVSTVPGGRLQAMSGTSMAAPHVTGVVGLLLQVNPRLTPTQLTELIVKSSKFVDENGNPQSTQTWNMAYGRGRLDAVQAVKFALQLLDQRLRRNIAMPFVEGGFGTNVQPTYARMTRPQNVSAEDLQLNSPIRSAVWATTDEVWSNR